MPQSKTDQLCRLVLLALVPAVIEKDLASFGEALEEVQVVVGSCFAAVQSGQFASTGSERLVAVMRAIGLQGVGQSSWGPCLYGFSDRGDEEREGMRQRMLEDCRLAHDRVFWTSASAGGAKVIVD
jgi:predicted sugar kinase